MACPTSAVTRGVGSSVLLILNVLLILLLDPFSESSRISGLPESQEGKGESVEETDDEKGPSSDRSKLLFSLRCSFIERLAGGADPGEHSGPPGTHPRVLAL